MSENRDLSIEEILKEAEAVLKSIDKKSALAKEEIKNVDEPLEPETVKTFVPKSENNTGHGNSDAAVKPYVPGKAKPRQQEPAEGKTAVVPSLDKQKTAKVPPTDKTAVVPIKKAEAKKFFKSYSSDAEYGSAPPKIIEKAATIKSRSRFDKTLDLQEIPTILAVEELDKTRVMLSKDRDNKSDFIAENEEYDNSDQIRMTGFDDEVDEVPVIDEELAEEQLRRRREEKVNKFRLFTPEEFEGDDKSRAKKIKFDDYRKSSERTETLESLFKLKTKIQLRISFTIVFGLLLLFLTVLKNTAYLPPFLNNDFNYYLTAIIIYAAVMITNIGSLLRGFNFKKGINFYFPITLASVIAMANTAALLANPDLVYDGGTLFSPAAAFALIIAEMGRRETVVRVIDNFEFLTGRGDKSTVEDIVNEVDARIISKNMLDGEPYLKYSVKTDFPTSFLEISFAYEPADKIAKVISPVFICINLIMFAVMGIVKHNWNEAFNLLTAGVIISCPAITLFASNYALSQISKSLSKKGAMVCGFEGAHYVHNSNALVMEAADLFSSRSCNLHGIKTFNGAKIDDAILQTAAVVMQIKSPLANVFDDVIIGKQSILPQAEDIVYEDKMGTSAWIYQKKVLVGNRDLLIRHGVTVPKEDYERKYTRKGRKALYLAVAGKVMAMFIVSYEADPSLKKLLKKLERSGITIILRSCDPYINEESLKNIFDVPEGFIRVMTASNGRSFEKYSGAVAEKSPAYSVHNGTAEAFIASVLGADNLVGTEKTISALCTFGCAIGFGVAGLLGFSGGMSQLTAVNVIIFQAVWSIFVLLVTKIRKNGV